MFFFAFCSRTYVMLLMGSSAGDTGALYRTEGNTPPSAEAQGRQREDAAAAEGAEGAPEQRASGGEIFGRSSGFQVRGR